MAELLTVPEVAKILKTNTAYVYKLKNAGLLKFMQLGRLKCRRETLDAFIDKYEGYDLSDPFNIKPIDIEGNEE